MENILFGKPLLEGIQYCTRCCIPATQEGVHFDEMGVCAACLSSEQKIHINWQERGKQLKEIFDDAKRKAGNNYDCIVPISGGKDSTFQLFVLTKIYNMKPLAVTFSHNWYSKTGWYNLINSLEEFEVDHVMFTPNRKLVNKIAKKSLSAIGDACWHCHSGVGSFPLKVAVQYNIPLLVWGESIAESSGRATHDKPVLKFDREYFEKVSAKKKPAQMVNEELSLKDLFPFELPSAEEVEKASVYGIHLGDYLFWDDERQMEFVRDNFGWMETEVEGSYKGYKSAECIMPGMHDFTCYLKRGYGRSTFQASVDVRNGLMTQEEGFEIARKKDAEEPGALMYYLEITGMSEKEFYKTMEAQKHELIIDQDLPVNKREKPNAEKIKPFALQLIDEMREEKEHKKKQESKS